MSNSDCTTLGEALDRLESEGFDKDVISLMRSRMNNELSGWTEKLKAGDCDAILKAKHPET